MLMIPQDPGDELIAPMDIRDCQTGPSPCRIRHASGRDGLAKDTAQLLHLPCRIYG